MPKALRFCGELIVHTAVAIIGTAFLESAIWKVFPAHSLGVILWKEWILSLSCAAVIGFFMWRTWKVSAAMWVWVLPSFWLILRFLFALAASQRQINVVDGGGLWNQFSGGACDGGSRTFGCRNFFVFTIPFVRGISIPSGRVFPRAVDKTKPHPTSEPLPEQGQSTS